MGDVKTPRFPRTSTVRPRSPSPAPAEVPHDQGAKYSMQIHNAGPAEIKQGTVQLQTSNDTDVHAQESLSASGSAQPISNKMPTLAELKGGVPFRFPRDSRLTIELMAQFDNANRLYVVTLSADPESTEVRRAFEENFRVYGVRKVWRQLSVYRSRTH